MRRTSFVPVVVLALAGAGSAQTLKALDQGWYESGGYHKRENRNYLAGECFGPCTVTAYRNFFVFDLKGVSRSVTGATLSVVMLPGTIGYWSPDPTETLTLFDYRGSIEALVAGNGGTAAFQDLGSGTPFGTRTFFATASQQRWEISLNRNAVAEINAARGGLFALGGALTSLDALANSEFIFGSSGDYAASLVLTYGGGEPRLLGADAVGTPARTVPLPTLIGASALPTPSRFLGSAFPLGWTAPRSGQRTGRFPFAIQSF